MRAEQGAAQAEQHADGQLDALARVHRRVGDDLLADDHHIADLLDMQGQGFIEQVAVLDDGLQRVAQGRLVGDEQADRAEVGELPRFGHAQAEGGAVAQAGRFLQQLDRQGGGDALLRIGGQQGLAETGLAQQLAGIQAEVPGHFEVVGQGGNTNSGRHVERFAGLEPPPRNRSALRPLDAALVIIVAVTKRQAG
ncbi:hypothetical protein D3C76_1134930 [compost metagenome]